MDIAKIRKKAKEREETEKAAEGSRPREERSDEPEAPPALPQADEAPEEQAGTAPGEGGPAGEETAAAPAAAEERPPAPPPVNKEGERGFAGRLEIGAENGMLELLTFGISNEEFAFRVPEVKEIIRYQRITKVPTLPDYVLGITSLRGKIIPVLDLQKRLGMKDVAAPEAKTKTSGRKILILAGPKGMIGAAIHKVLGVVRFEAGTILDPPGHLSENELRFIEGVAILEKRFISIIRSYDALEIGLT
jgi:purine-binding chemotaxis protein CheW